MNNQITTNNPVHIIDEPMGSGKTESAINFINNNNEARFLVITPYKSEIERYKASCPNKHFMTPTTCRGRGSKLNDIKNLIRNGYNIVSTHALFQRFDDEIIELCSLLNYVLILDEVAEVVQESRLSKDDVDNLLSMYCDYNEETGLLTWREERKNYVGKFSEQKNLCNLGGLALARDKMLVWLFPIEVFRVFEEVYILTYMFNAQLQRYYYDYYGIRYDFIHVAGSKYGEYHFSDTSGEIKKYNYNNLVHILDNNKMNALGKGYYNLSSTWYERNHNTAVMQQLKNNLYNYFFNIRASKSSDNLWTTYKDYENVLSGKGYKKGFLFLNARATNDYREKSSIAYLVNIFINPMIKGFFQDHGVDVDEDGYALSEMLQWIWRSAIRDGKEIWVYIPSSRMRSLLEKWINDVSDINIEK